MQPNDTHLHKLATAIRARDTTLLRAEATYSVQATTQTLRRESLALLAALFGALATVIVMGILRLWWGTLTPPELIGERILPFLSAGKFVELELKFQPHPKTGPLSLALLGMVIIGILLGPAYAISARRHNERVGPSSRWLPNRRAWSVAGAFAVGMTLLAILLFWPILRASLYGDPIPSARLLTMVSLLLTFAAYASVTALSYAVFRHIWGGWAEGQTPQSTALQPTGDQITRRDALAVGGAAAVTLVAGVLTTNGLIASYLDRSNLRYEGNGVPGRINTPITPNENFYVVSKNVLDPTVVVDRWRLEVQGGVKQPKSWTYAEMLQLPAETRAVTLECISNGIGGRIISTAVWRGITLQTLLGLAGGVTGAPADKHIVFYGVDGYATSLPLGALLEARTLLAYEMNGVTLPERHGYPLRAIVPGRYGEQNAKWITRIEVIDYDYKGFYQSQGWNASPLETITRIDTPQRAAPLGAIPISGIAFAGIRGVKQVEVSVDAGNTWHAATLAPPLSDQTWVLWNWTWRPTTPGTYTLIARTTDGSGKLQTAQKRGTVPDGATGWHAVNVLVK